MRCGCEESGCHASDRTQAVGTQMSSSVTLKLGPAVRPDWVQVGVA
jgi:hypothetical protein